MRPSRLVLLGHPVGHSASPRFQNAALRAAGIPLRYEGLDVPPAEIGSALRMLIGEGAAGNATIPHKAAVYATCVRRTDVATRAAAVNTFWVEPVGLCGDNTDVAGFDRAAEALAIRREGARVVLLGAGGAASAVCVATSSWPDCMVDVVARRPEAAARLAARHAHVTVAADAEASFARCSLVVNATPVGLRDDATPCDLDLVSRDAAVMDLVYRAGETMLVRAARASGRTASDGSEMLLWQGALAFHRWFGIMPDLGVMRSALGESP